MTEATTVVAPKAPAKKTITNWNGFVKAGLAPKRIVCQGYAPIHRRDNGCHSALLLDAGAFDRHVDAQHEGGFKLFLRRSEVPWKGWLELGDKGYEIHDLRCDVCDAELPVHPQHLLKHMEAHTGKMKRPRVGGDFLMTIRKDKPLPPVDDAE